MCICVYIYICGQVGADASRDQRRGLELQTVISYQILMVGAKLGSFGKAASTLN